MPRGGARPGAGRKRIDSEAKAEQVLNDLLIPAFQDAFEHGEVLIGSRDIQDAFGKQGLREWLTWFEEVEVGHGFRGVGGVKSRWRLKLKLAVAAKKLLTTVDVSTLKFPPDIIDEAGNRKAYDRWCAQFQVEAQKLHAEFGTPVRQPPAYESRKNWRTKEFEVRDKAPRGPLTDATKGWSELVTGGSNGFTGEAVVPSNLTPDDIPF